MNLNTNPVQPPLEHWCSGAWFHECLRVFQNTKRAKLFLTLVDALLIFTLDAGFQFAADRLGEGLVISGKEQGS